MLSRRSISSAPVVKPGYKSHIISDIDSDEQQWEYHRGHCSIYPIGVDRAGPSWVNIIVIDVLRGSSTIINALKNGANRIVPVGEVADARAMADNYSTGEFILCAERNGLRVEGFSLGNSPMEYDPEIVAGKDLIYSSTNCSKALLASYAADRVLVGTFNNLTAVWDSLILPGRIFLVCSGKMGTIRSRRRGLRRDVCQ